MLRIVIQSKGRLSERSFALLEEAGITVDDSKRKCLSQSDNFPVEVLFLRDDDIPQVVGMGVADLGIVGYNEVLERGQSVEVVDRLGFGSCRVSLAIPKGEMYEGLSYFEGKRIATSYPGILGRFLCDRGIHAKVSVIAGSVEIAPAVRDPSLVSRSRQTLWTKGETSGNYLHLVSVTPDCDADTLLVRARPVAYRIHPCSPAGDPGPPSGVAGKILHRLAFPVRSAADGPETRGRGGGNGYRGGPGQP